MIAGAGGLAACQLAWNVLAARGLGPAKYGILTFLLSNISLASGMMGASIGLSAARYGAASDAGELREEISFSLLLIAGAVGIGGFIAVLLAAPAIVKAAPSLAGRVDLLGLAGVFFAGSVISGVAIGILSGYSRFRRIAWIYLTQGITSLLLIGWASSTGNLLAALAGAAVGALVAAGLAGGNALLILRRRGSLRFYPGIPRILALHSGPSLLSGVAVVCGVTWSHLILIDGGGPAQIAWFNAANQWRALALFVPISLSPVLVNKLAALADSGAQQAQASFWNYKATALFTGLAAILLVSSSSLVAGLYGSEFAAVQPPLTLLTWAFYFAALNNTTGHQLASQPSHWPSLLLNLVYTAGVVSVVWWKSSLPTATLLASAYLAGSFLQWLVSTFYWATIFTPKQMFEVLVLPLGVLGCLGIATAGSALSDTNWQWLAFLAISSAPVFSWTAREVVKR